MNDPKFSVGDYIAGRTTIFMRIVAVLAGPVHTYAIANASEDHLHWFTEAQILANKWTASEPAFGTFEAVQPGDMIQMSRDSDVYVKVLARTGDAVLLSQAPVLAAELMMLGPDGPERSVDPEDLPDEAQAYLKDIKSTTKAYRRAGNWYDVHQLALFNWSVLQEEKA